MNNNLVPINNNALSKSFRKLNLVSKNTQSAKPTVIDAEYSLVVDKPSRTPIKDTIVNNYYTNIYVENNEEYYDEQPVVTQQVSTGKFIFILFCIFGFIYLLNK